MTFTAMELEALTTLRRRIERGEVSEFYDTWLYRAAGAIADNAPALILGCTIIGFCIAALLAALWLPV